VWSMRGYARLLGPDNPTWRDVGQLYTQQHALAQHLSA